MKEGEGLWLSEGERERKGVEFMREWEREKIACLSERGRES